MVGEGADAVGATTTVDTQRERNEFRSQISDITDDESEIDDYPPDDDDGKDDTDSEGLLPLEVVRETLIEFYLQHNPNKLSEVDAILTAYRGNEETLLENLRMKYHTDIPSLSKLISHEEDNDEKFDDLDEFMDFEEPQQSVASHYQPTGNPTRYKPRNFIASIIVLVLASTTSFFSVNSYTNIQAFKFKTYGNGNATSVVLIPGLDGAVAFFADTIPELTASGFHVVQYFLPLKTKDMRTAEYTFESIAEDLHSVLHETGTTNPVIVGESFGGVVAQHFAFKYPGEVSAMVLLSSLAKTQLPPEIEWKVQWLLPIVKNLGELFPDLAQYLFARIHAEDVVEQSEPQYVRDLFVKEAANAHFYSVMARIGIVHKLDIEEKTQSINTPTLIIHGEDDHFTRKDSLRLHELINGSQLLSLPGGHLPHISSPKRFAEMIVSFTGATIDVQAYANDVADASATDVIALKVSGLAKAQFRDHLIACLSIPWSWSPQSLKPANCWKLTSLVSGWPNLRDTAGDILRLRDEAMARQLAGLRGDSQGGGSSSNRTELCVETELGAWITSDASLRGALFSCMASMLCLGLSVLWIVVWSAEAYLRLSISGQRRRGLAAAMQRRRCRRFYSQLCNFIIVVSVLLLIL